MKSKAVSGIMLTLLLIGIYVCFFGVTRVKAELVWKHKISSTFGTNCVSTSGDGNYVAAGNSHGLFLFDRSGNLLWQYATDVYGDTPDAVSLSYDGSYIAVGSERAQAPMDGYVYLFDQEFTGDSYLWRYHLTRGIESVSISSDGNYIVAKSHDGYVYFFDKEFRGNSYLWKYFIRYGYGNLVDISADGKYVVAVNDEEPEWVPNRGLGEVFLFDKNLTGDSYLWKYTIGGSVRTVAITKDGKYVVAGTRKGDSPNVYFFDRNLTGGDCLWKYQVDRFALHVSVSAHGDYVAVGSYGISPSSYGNVYLFDKNFTNGTYLWSNSFNRYVFYALLSDDGEYLVAGIGNGNVYQFDKQGTLLWEYPTGGDGFSHAGQCAISSDGDYVAAGHSYYVFLLSWTPTLPVHNIDTGEDFETIQEAINDSDTLNGHTILVEVGIYSESVIINKSISLIGENRSTTIIDGGGIGSPVYIMASFVTVTGFKIQNSRFEYLYSGMRIDGCNYNNITGNTLTNNFDGIFLTQSSNNTICNNIILDNEWNGIHLKYDSNYNAISSNTILNNGNGINIEAKSNNNYMLNNHIADSEWDGIDLAGSQSNSIEGNTITNCFTGIYLGSETDNMNAIYHNSFISNTYQVTCYSSPNMWDDGYPSGGNYWSDHVTVDDCCGVNQDELGSDGIVDEPYIIDNYNRDNYPLVEPWSPKPPSPQEALEELIQTVELWNLNKGIEISLTSKLRAAYRSLDRENQKASLGQLTAFINQVKALRDKKLNNEQADQLISEAQRIIDLIKE